MVIDKDEIEKYIFDPQNPQQCKSYKLLLRIAKKENYSFFSPEFLLYFFGEQILNDKFKEELWDIPDNYNDLTFNEKIKLFKEQLSQDDLDDYINSIDIDKININKIEKYSFISSLYKIVRSSYPSQYEFNYFNTDKLKDFILTNIFKIDEIYQSNSLLYEGKRPNHGLIIFSKNYFHILNSAPKKASVFITLEENIDKFLEYKNNENIKPIFLKKIEDVDLLLNILENDLKKEKANNIKKEDISTIDKIEIKNFFSIKNLQLDNLKNKKEIYILGENGDGKTLLLQAIAIALKGVQKDGQERFRKIKDEFELKVTNSDSQRYLSDENIYKNMFAYGASRNNNCQIKDDEVGYLTLFDGSLDLKDPVKWLQLLDYSESKNENNVISVAQAKKLIQELLNKEVEIDISPTQVSFKERGTEEVEFDRLSAGYKGVITIICDMLVRLSENQPYVTEIKEYQGIVLIDEVELHLHPKWKYDFMKKLRELFPLVQFIVTTHSPTVILGASKEAVFYKIYKENGEVCISNQMVNEGYTNNSLISSPLFDLKDFTSRDYDKKVNSDDYIYDKIHKVIASRIKKNININEEEILKLIDEELEKI